MAIIVEISLYIFVISYLCRIFAFKYEMLFLLSCQWQEHQHFMWSAYETKLFCCDIYCCYDWYLNSCWYRVHWLALLFINIFLIFNLIVQCADLVVLFTSCAGIILTLKMAYLDIRMIKKTNFFLMGLLAVCSAYYHGAGDGSWHTNVE